MQSKDKYDAPATSLSHRNSRDRVHERCGKAHVCTNRGVALTNEGNELLAYARQIVEQANMLEEHYASKSHEARFSVSTQHYAFCVRAFIDTVDSCEDEEYDFIMREAATGEIIDDVRTHRSDIGILYIDRHNARVLRVPSALRGACQRVRGRASSAGRPRFTHA